MLKLIINKKKYLYRSKQSEISWKLGQELESVRKEYDCDCNPELQKWQLAILCGCDYNVADLVSEEQLAKLLGVHPFFGNEIRVGLPTYIKIQKKLYEYDCNEMTVLRYSELDMLANDGDFLKLFQSLYKPIKCIPKHWLRYLLIKNVKSFDNCNYFQVKLAIYQYFQWKQELMREYKISMFDENMGIEQQPDKVILSPAEKFGMYHIVMQVSGDDIQKFHWWQDRDIRELFKYLLYLRRKNISQ